MLLVALVFWMQGGGQESLARRSSEARDALLAGDSAKAVRVYRGLVAEMPSDSRLRLNLALALEAAGSYAQELAELRVVTKAQPGLTPAWLMTGLAYLKLGRANEAIAPLRTVLQREPVNRTARVELADALLQHGDYRESLALFRELAAEEPGSPQLWAGVGLSASAFAQQALEKLERSAGRDEWRLLSARAEIGAMRYERAFGLLKAIAKPIAGVHGALAEIYVQTGHDDWAALEREREAAFHAPPPGPEYSAILDARAAAELAVQRLLALPESAALHELLASLHRERGERAEAVEEWRKAAALAAGEPRLRARLAAALATNRSWEEAVDILTPLVGTNPETAEWRYLLGDALLQQRRMEEAIPHLEAALSLNPALLTAHASLGRAYLETGKAALAVPHLKAAVGTDEETLLFQLAQAYRLTGQAALAAKTMERREAAMRKKIATPAAPPDLPVTAPDLR